MKHCEERDDSAVTWTYKAKNTLMYVPEGVPLTSQEILEKSKSTRIINHANTRFNSDMISSLHKSLSTPQTSEMKPKLNPLGMNVIAKIGIDGKEANHDTPKVKGYSFVDASPSPMPGRSFGDESPMMTWGEIEGTPFRLEGSSTPYFGKKFAGAPEFKIPDVPEREKLALNLEEKASAARRKKKNDALKHVQRNLASPSSIADKINNMSPAAQRLLSVKLNLKCGDRNSATPSPRSVKSTTGNMSPFISSPICKTPTSNSSMDNLRSTLKRQTTDSITDNLLKLPKMT